MTILSGRFASFFLLVLFLFQLTNAQIPQLKWVETAGGSRLDYSIACAHDEASNSYHAGLFRDTVAFNSPSGAVMISNGDGDGYVQKINSSGQILWTKTFGGSGFDGISSIYVDSRNMVYVSGAFSDTVDFDPGAGTSIKMSQGAQDAFLLKLDTNGFFIWVETFGGIGDDLINTIDVDYAGNIYFGGQFEDVVDFDYGIGIDLRTSHGASDAFLVKTNSMGMLQWVRNFGGPFTDLIQSISVSNHGMVYSTGYFRDTVDFDQNGGGDFHISNGQDDAYLQALDTQGNYMWTKTFGGAILDIGWVVATDTFGMAYVAGAFMDTIDIDPGTATQIVIANSGSTDAFLVKFDQLGNLVWANTFGGAHSELGTDLFVDDGQLFLSGYFGASVDFDPGITVDLHSSKGSLDMFVQQTDISGTYISNFTAGGPALDIAYSISVSPAAQILVTGTFQDTADFDPGLNSVVRKEAGGGDIFAASYKKTPLSVQENAKTLAFKLYPNPSEEGFQLDFKSHDEELLLEIIDVNGMLVRRLLISNKDEIVFGSDLPEGIYIIRLHAGNQVHVKKWIKLKR